MSLFSQVFLQNLCSCVLGQSIFSEGKNKVEKNKVSPGAKINLYDNKRFHTLFDCGRSNEIENHKNVKTCER